MIQLNTKDIHLWQLSKADLASYDDRLLALLAADEIERMQKFKFEKDQVAFGLYRGALRKILSEYVDCSAEKLSFQYSDKGKPFLDLPVSFNLSHAGDCALIAVSKEARIGVDIENTQRKHDILPIAQRFFHPNEYQAIMAQPEANRECYAYQLWCFNEAMLKATGEGVAFGLDKFEVQFDGEQAQLLSVEDDSVDVSDWSILPLGVANGYCAAIAAEVRNPVLSNFNIINYL